MNDREGGLLAWQWRGYPLAHADRHNLVIHVCTQPREPPAPFRGPLDVVTRLFVEQFVTFPRFLLTGGFAAAWRQGASSNTSGATPR